MLGVVRVGRHNHLAVLQIGVGFADLDIWADDDRLLRVRGGCRDSDEQQCGECVHVSVSV